MAGEVTVLVCTRDRPELVDRCLRALLDGTSLPDDLLIVDQSRDDRTLAVVERLSAEHGPRVRGVHHAGRGLAAAQNHGFRLARHEIVLVTDDDAVPARDWVETGRRLFQRSPDLALIAGRVLPLGPDRPGCFPVSTRTSTVARELDATALPWDVGSGNCFGLRREVALRVGNDERLGPGAPLLGGADMDLFRRLLKGGGRGVYAPELVVLHERTSAQGRLDRRIPYGYGMGAALSLGWRQGDRAVGGVLVAWLGMRAGRLVRGVRSRDALRVREEALVLLGTFRGLVRGALVRPAQPLRTDGV